MLLRIKYDIKSAAALSSAHMKQKIRQYHILPYRARSTRVLHYFTITLSLSPTHSVFLHFTFTILGVPYIFHFSFTFDDHYYDHILLILDCIRLIPLIYYSFSALFHSFYCTLYFLHIMPLSTYIFHHYI
jgi:hypothetical protein